MVPQLQAVVPCPSSHSHTPFTTESVSTEAKISLSSDIVQPLVNKGNNKITELRTILQRESQNS
jgi:hypothetical protein